MSVLIRYVASSGNEYNLKADGIKIKEANFHNYSWDFDMTERTFGVLINKLRRGAASYEATLCFRGSYLRRRNLIEALHVDFERDVLNLTPGRLYWAGDYIECYIIVSSTYPGDGNTETYNEIEIFVPYPFWIEESTFSIYPGSESALEETDIGYLDGGYQYPYSYAKSQNAKTIVNDHYAPCNFKLIAYGPASSLRVNIAGHLYRIDYPVPAGGYMVIDSRESQPADRRVYVVDSSGTVTNVFDWRDPSQSLFTKIPPGNVVVDYSREYGIDLTLYKERSEPKNV